ncbi:MAG: hypothetical protein ACRCTE_06605 [Cellulosilyticaceae bacterium]
MFNKKQFITLLILAVGIFAVIFTLFFTVFYRSGIENPIVQPEATVPVVRMGETTPSIVEPEIIRVKPTTHVFLKMVDDQGARVAEQKIPVESLLGFSEEQVKKCFYDYKLTVFSEEQVILEKVVEKPSIEPRYKLALQGDQIGIKTYGETEQFEPLGLLISDYSSSVHVLLLDEMIELTLTEKKSLQQNPNRIEQILQDYSE